MTRRIALVGTAPSSIHAPFADPSWEIWCVGARGDHVTRITRFFELHRIDGDKDPADWRRCYREWCQDCELWMMFPEPDLVPKVMPFPWQRLKDRFGTFFMTSSFAWMMALAIDEAPDEIGIFGVDMEYGTEYREQRAGLRHFIGIATFAGIAVTRLVAGGVTYEPIPYPFWQDDPLLQKVKLRRQTLKREQAARETAANAAIARIGQIEAVVAALRSLTTVTADTGEAVAEFVAKAEFVAQIRALGRESGGLHATLPKLQGDAAWCKGALDEIDWLEDFLKP